MFRAADQVLITKTDLLPYIEEFSMARARASIRAVRGEMPIIELSSKNGNGLWQWVDWLVKSATDRKIAA
jgi:hydrogenase nickel incorporation protein HypB